MCSAVDAKGFAALDNKSIEVSNKQTERKHGARDTGKGSDCGLTSTYGRIEGSLQRALEHVVIDSNI